MIVKIHCLLLDIVLSFSLSLHTSIPYLLFLLIAIDRTEAPLQPITVPKVRLKAAAFRQILANMCKVRLNVNYCYFFMLCRFDKREEIISNADPNLVITYPLGLYDRE